MLAEKDTMPAESENDRNRRLLREDFLARLSLGDAKITPLRIDASVRRFFRVEKDGKSQVLMDARPPLEDTSVFEIMQKKLKAIGLTVPEITACDHATGLALMEDFGDVRLFELITEQKEDINKLYTLATDVLVHKYFADPAIALDQSVAYSDDYWLFRIEQFLQHYMPHIAKREVSAGAREDFLGLFRQAINGAHLFPQVLLHGDYGAQNLYYLPEREGIKQLGLIDFQDMTDARGNMMGSPAFDLVFLLQDVRIHTDPALEIAMRERFIEKTGIKDVTSFEGEYATIGAAQAAKCLGLFARLGVVNGRSEYLSFIPHCWRNLEQNLRHPSLKGIRDWFEKNNITKDIQG